jgi:hypothetical protein
VADSDKNVLGPLVKGWSEKIKLAIKHKKDRFQDDANEAMRFFNGPHDFMYETAYGANSKAFRVSQAEGLQEPQFQMTVNKVAEMVQLFGPVLYHKNPVRQVNPRKIPLPPMNLFGDPNDPNVQMGYMQLMQQSQQERSIDAVRALLMQFMFILFPSSGLPPGASPGDHGPPSGLW